MKIHIPVLLNDVIDCFANIKNGVIIDCTIGYGGHSRAILEANPNIRILGFDRDKEAVDFCSNYLCDFRDRVDIFHSKFSNSIDIAMKWCKNNNMKIRGILADIGVSSLQIDKDDRGFGLKSSKLDMRMDKNDELDAKFIVNNYSKDRLADIFIKFAQLPNANKIAQKIVQYRQEKPIEDAKTLASIINSFKIKNRSVSSATLAFQALRIEVNKELDEIENLLKNIKNSGIKDAYVCVITFHSLEDRIVKNTFKGWQKKCICPDFVLKCQCGGNHNLGVILKNGNRASKDEILQNSRANCARIRSFYIYGEHNNEQ